MPSARSTASLAATVAAGFGLMLLLPGCETTQDANARLLLRGDHTRASRLPVNVTTTDPNVKVLAADAVRGKDNGAIVVSLRNDGDTTATDLPIEVGVRSGGSETPLNAKGAEYYGENHAPALPPGKGTTWVFPVAKAVPPGTAFARVGPPPAGAATPGDDLPEIQAELQNPLANSTLSVKITNKSDIPQYDMGVYAVAKKGSSYVAAGEATLEHLGSNGTATVQVPVAGDGQGAQFQIFVTPTFFK